MIFIDNNVKSEVEFKEYFPYVYINREDEQMIVEKIIKDEDIHVFIFDKSNEISYSHMGYEGNIFIINIHDNSNLNRCTSVEEKNVVWHFVNSDLRHELQHVLDVISMRMRGFDLPRTQQGVDNIKFKLITELRASYSTEQTIYRNFIKTTPLNQRGEHKKRLKFKMVERLGNHINYAKIDSTTYSTCLLIGAVVSIANIFRISIEELNTLRNNEIKEVIAVANMCEESNCFENLSDFDNVDVDFIFDQISQLAKKLNKSNDILTGKELKKLNKNGKNI